MSELGDPVDYVSSTRSQGAVAGGEYAPDVHSRGFTGVQRNVASANTAQGWARGPVGFDTRKHKYDYNRGVGSAPLSFSASKADRMDPEAAGALLENMFTTVGIPTDEEARRVAFERAMHFEHTVNGASMLQPGRGSLKVDGVEFDIDIIKRMMGVEQRRFFRAFADEIADTNRMIIAAYDPYDAESAEKYGQLMQVAAERGLQKFPHLAHDSADACLNLSHDERFALIASKTYVLPVVNQVDILPPGRYSDLAEK